MVEREREKTEGKVEEKKESPVKVEEVINDPFELDEKGKERLMCRG